MCMCMRMQDVAGLMCGVSCGEEGDGDAEAERMLRLMEGAEVLMLPVSGPASLCCGFVHVTQICPGMLIWLRLCGCLQPQSWGNLQSQNVGKSMSFIAVTKKPRRSASVLGTISTLPDGVANSVVEDCKNPVMTHVPCIHN